VASGFDAFLDEWFFVIIILLYAFYKYISFGELLCPLPYDESGLLAAMMEG